MTHSDDVQTVRIQPPSVGGVVSWLAAFGLTLGAIYVAFWLLVISVALGSLAIYSGDPATMYHALVPIGVLWGMIASSVVVRCFLGSALAVLWTVAWLVAIVVFLWHAFLA